MSRSTDRSGDASPFAWVFGATLAVVAVGAVVRTALGRRRDVPLQARDEAPDTVPGTGDADGRPG